MREQHLKSRVLPYVLYFFSLYLNPMKHMKHIPTHTGILFLVMLFLVQDVQAQSWQWGKRGGSGSPATNSCCLENAVDITTDRNGNIYVLGNANMGINVDNHMHPGYGNNLSSGNVIIASWDCNGSFRWMKVIGSYTSSAGKSLRTDTLGGVYLSGYTISSNPLGYTHFDSDTTLGNTHKSMFIVKYDTAGNYKWLRMPQADTVGPAAITYTGVVDMDVAPDGEIFLLCYLNPGLYNGTYVVSTPGVYVCRYSAAGAFLGGTPLDITLSGGSGGGANLYNIQQSKFKRDHLNGRYYIAGHYDAFFGNMTFGITPVNQASFLGSFSSTGTVQWTRQSATTNAAYATAGMISGRPATDGQSNIYITGNTFNGQSFNGHTFNNTLSNIEWPCPFVLKLDPNGNNIWATNASVIGAANGFALTVNDNELAVTGNYFQEMKWDGFTLKQGMNEKSDIFLARLNTQTGTLSGIDTLTSSFGVEEMSTAAVRDKRGNYYLSGSYFADIVVGNNTLNNIGGETDWFVAKFGKANCNCVLPVAAFSNANGSGNTINFSYTGTMPVDSVVWDFGNGDRGTGLTISKTYVQSGLYNVCATAYNSCGAHTYCKSLSTNGVGIGGSGAFSKSSIFPNPVNSMLCIEGLPEQVRYTLYNGIGRVMQHGILSKGKSVIDMSGFSNGWYIIEMQDKAGEKHRVKLVKQ
jgi:hypothetical protein